MDKLFQSTPEYVTDVINSMFNELTPIIHKHDGIVDKYLGDGMLAVFVEPKIEQNNENAVRAAIEMQERMHQLEIKRRNDNKPVVEIGIGIHTGTLLQSAIGPSGEKIEYTVIGNIVNAAARLCDGAKKGEILISEAVHQCVFGIVECETGRENKTKHPDTEPNIKVHPVKRLK